jgi:membrane dipeptidase
MFSYELACHLDDRFAAIASFAGTMPVAPSDCEPERNVPLLHLHGTDDPIIAYDNTWNWKSWDSVGAMRDISGLVNFWQDRFNCREQSQTEGDGSLHIVHQACDQDARVEHYRIDTGGHEWPETIKGVSTHDVIWSFLSSFSMPSSQAETSADIESRARDIHDRVLVFDAHADIVPAGDAQAREIADTELAAVAEIADAHDGVVVVRSADELVAAHARGDTSIMIGLQNARILEGNVGAIDEFYQAGVRIFALTHLGHNDFADSSRPVYNGATKRYEPTEEHGGLSDLGRAAVKRINELGAVVDVSQLSENATLQAAQLSATPVIASHSNVRVLSQVARNLSNAEIDLIGKTGGVVHIAAFTAYLLDISDEDLIRDIKAVRREAGIDERYTYPYELYWEIADPTAQTAFLTTMRELLGPATVDRMVDHIDYIVDRIGVDHVGIGNDFNHSGGIQGFDNAAEALNLTHALVKRGYTAEDIEKIWGGSFIRVLRTAEQHAG